MAGVSDKQLISLGPWPAGVVNVPTETKMPLSDKGKVLGVRELVNGDWSNAGVPSRRAGYVKRYSGTMVHSGWRGGSFPFALFVDDGTLYALPRGGAPAPLVTGLGTRDVSYCLVGDRVFWGNGQQSGIVTRDGETRSWGIETPNGQPALALGGSGGLDAGQCQVAVTFRNMAGETSGTPRSAVIDVPQGGSIVLTSIPQPISGDVSAVRIHCSPPDGGKGLDESRANRGQGLLFLRDIPVGMTSTTISTPARGLPLETQHLETVPPPSTARLLNGRIYFVTDRNSLGWTEALQYGLWDPLRNRIRFGKQITLLESVADGTDSAGMYVADESRTFWISGEPGAFKRTTAYAHAATPGTAVRVPANVFGVESTQPAVYWLAANGVACLGLPGGVVLPLREQDVVAANAVKGASLFREFDGLRQVITALQGSSRREFAMGDRVVARHYRDGVEIGPTG